MVVKREKNILRKNQKGQALFEFLLFLPLTFLMITLFMTMGNSINGAINQQKITRGYFYYDVAGNSMTPTKHRVKGWHEANLNNVSINAIGWRMKTDPSGRYPVSPCYKLNSKLTGPTQETCEDSSSVMKSDETPSAFVRIYTVYGICATPYYYTSAGGNDVVRYNAQQWSNCGLSTD